MLNLTDKKILYVDPNNQYFNFVQGILLPDVTSKAAKKLSLERSPSYFDCISKIKGKSGLLADGVSAKVYDIIFCEYELGNSKTAQDLLEELRKSHLIPLSTVFIMIAAERFREKVMSVLEYAPDSYILKGVNTADDIEKRIVRAIRDRMELLHIYSMIDNKDYKKALTLCEEYVRAGGRLSNHVKKLTGFVYLELHDYEKAKATYSGIIESASSEVFDGTENKLTKTPPPYAKVGLAKAKYFLGEKEEAVELMKDTITHNPDYMEGYDALASLYMSSGDTESAQSVLEDATKKSPGKFDRQKLLGLVALDNEDFDVAESAFKKLTGDGKFSYGSHPENFVHLAEVHIHKGDLSNAMKVLKQTGDVFSKTDLSDVASFCEARMGSVIAEKQGDHKKASELSRKAASLHTNEGFSGMSERLQTMVATKFISEGHELGDSLFETIVRNSSNKDSVESRAKKMVAGKPHLENKISKMRKQVEEKLTKTLDNALATFKNGNRKMAMDLIDMLVEESPKNLQILSKAAMLYLMSVSGNSEADIQFFKKGKKFLHSIKSISSDFKDIKLLESLLSRVSEKSGLKDIQVVEFNEVKGTEETVESLGKLQALLDKISL